MLKEIDITELVASNTILSEILKSTIIQFSFANYGYIAGGFARKVYRMYSDLDDPELESYFLKEEHGSGGDIDVFFTCSQDANITTKDLEVDQNIRGYPSFLKVATNYPHYNTGGRLCEAGRNSTRNSIPVQIIHKEEYSGEVEDVLGKFDLLNSMAAIVNENTLLVDERLIDHEHRSALGVSRIDGNLLSSRLNKYLFKRKGLTHIDSKSCAKITSWIAQVATGQPVVKEKLGFLIKKGVIPSEDLVMLAATGFELLENRRSPSGHRRGTYTYDRVDLILENL